MEDILHQDHNDRLIFRRLPVPLYSPQQEWELLWTFQLEWAYQWAAA